MFITIRYAVSCNSKIPNSATIHEAIKHSQPAGLSYRCIYILEKENKRDAKCDPPCRQCGCGLLALSVIRVSPLYHWSLLLWIKPQLAIAITHSSRDVVQSSVVRQIKTSAKHTYYSQNFFGRTSSKSTLIRTNL